MTAQESDSDHDPAKLEDRNGIGGASTTVDDEQAARAWASYLDGEND